ncbi:nuclear transport factor 2 family protein [Streptomyces apocyni]|uniref:nuclear transport factor 2 family protein n=1 Tax=Streptomyces apocyni TaxID=2654677 RepID=UPI0012EAAC12|nr:nuclear transport factor 2 family protein [Streptomyces apocyni]
MPGQPDAPGQLDTPGLSDPLDVVHAAYRAFRDRDVEGLLSTLAPDIAWVHPESMAEFGLGGTKSGHAGVKEFLAHVPTVIGGMRLQPREFIRSGDRVIVFGVRDVTSVNGHTETLTFVHSWTIREGRATRMEDIFDTAQFQQLIHS